VVRAAVQARKVLEVPAAAAAAADSGAVVAGLEAPAEAVLAVAAAVGPGAAAVSGAAVVVGLEAPAEAVLAAAEALALVAVGRELAEQAQALERAARLAGARGQAAVLALVAVGLELAEQARVLAAAPELEVVPPVAVESKHLASG